MHLSANQKYGTKTSPLSKRAITLEGIISTVGYQKDETIGIKCTRKIKWLFGDDLNKKINKISSTNTALITHIISMIIIMVAKHVAINTTMVQKTLKLPGGVLL